MQLVKVQAELINRNVNSALVSVNPSDSLSILSPLLSLGPSLKSLGPILEDIRPSGAPFDDVLSILKFANGYLGSPDDAFGGCLRAAVTGQPAHSVGGGEDGVMLDVFVTDFGMFRAVTNGVVEEVFRGGEGR